MMKKIEIKVSGRVQGVGFRYFTLSCAQEFSIQGNVRNTSTGKVKVIAVGSEDNMEFFLQKINRGPRMAIVEKMEINELSAVKDFSDFRIEH